MRHQRSLAGTWQFQLDPDGTLTHASLAPDREITVPMPWQAAFPELERYSGYAWYQHTIDLTDEWLGGELLLRFGAVDYWCQVFINGALAGQHEGGYTAFDVPIAAHARPGQNTIAVRVYDPVQTAMITQRWPEYPEEQFTGQPPFDANNVPHGKQEWYINVGGIWQDVKLLAVPSTWLARLHVATDIASGAAQLTVELGGAVAQASGTLQVAIEGAGTADVALVAGQSVYETNITVEQPRLWNLDTPELYTATARLDNGDELSTRFGFRAFTTKDGQFLMNGEPLFLLSALDQDLYPDTIYTVPSEEFLRDQFRKAKELGFNNLRCHIKPPDPMYLDLADEMGLLVWAEIPSWRTFPNKGTYHPGQLRLDDTIKARVEHTLEEMVQRDFNHPSLVVWTIVNEDWGTTLALSADDRAWVAAMYDRCKQLDPTRLVVDNSACFNSWGPNVHVKSDMDDFHIYANIPDDARTFEQHLEQFNLRPLWTYSSHGDTQRTGKEPLVLSEFGNWGLPSLQKLREHYNGDPDWFKLGPWWSRWEGEPGWPAGVAERFEQLGLDKVWGDYEQFATATQWHQYAAMKFEIETMRRLPNLSGYVITELSDIYWESNGVLDFARNTKAYHDVFGTINAPDVIIPQVRRYSYWDDEQVTVHLHLSHYSAADWNGARLSWRVAGGERGGAYAVPAVARGTVAELGTARWSLPTVEAAQNVQFELTLVGTNGDTLARNTLDVLVLPASSRAPSYTQPIALISGGSPSQTTLLDIAPGSEATMLESSVAPLDTPLDETIIGFTHRLAELGYQTSDLSADTQVAVTNRPTAELLAWVREGGSLLFLARGASPFFSIQGRGGAYSGNWMTNWSWMRPEVNQQLSAFSPLSMPFMQVMPRSTIVGLPFEDAAVQGDFLAGLIGGWVNHPAVHTAQFRYGAGRVLMTTFNLGNTLGIDPVGTALFHSLLAYLASDACQPTLAASY